MPKFQQHSHNNPPFPRSYASSSSNMRTTTLKPKPGFVPNTEPMFIDGPTVSGMMLTLLAAVAVSLILGAVLEYANKLKRKGLLVGKVRMLERVSGWDLGWVLRGYGLDPVSGKPLRRKKQGSGEVGGSVECLNEQEEEEDGARTLGTSSGHPRKGKSAYGNADKGILSGVAVSLAKVFTDSSKGHTPEYAPEYASTLRKAPSASTSSSSCFVQPPKAVGNVKPKKPTSTTSTTLLPFPPSPSPSPRAAMPRTSSTKSPSTPRQEPPPTTTPTPAPKSTSFLQNLSYDFKPPTLYPTRSDPFHPALSVVPPPLAHVLDTSDVLWEAAVSGTAWGLGVLMKPVVGVSRKVVKGVEGGVEGVEVLGRRVGMRVGVLKRMMATAGVGGSHHHHQHTHSHNPSSSLTNDHHQMSASWNGSTGTLTQTMSTSYSTPTGSGVIGLGSLDKKPSIIQSATATASPGPQRKRQHTIPDPTSLVAAGQHLVAAAAVASVMTKEGTVSGSGNPYRSTSNTIMNVQQHQHQQGGGGRNRSVSASAPYLTPPMSSSSVQQQAPPQQQQHQQQQHPPRSTKHQPTTSSLTSTSSTANPSSSYPLFHQHKPLPPHTVSHPKFPPNQVFKIRAKEGYISSDPTALNYNYDTAQYFVSTQYATPFARGAVCGLVPGKCFEVVDLNSKEPPLPSKGSVSRAPSSQQKNHHQQQQQQQQQPHGSRPPFVPHQYQQQQYQQRQPQQQQQQLQGYAPTLYQNAPQLAPVPITQKPVPPLPPSSVSTSPPRPTIEQQQQAAKNGYAHRAPSNQGSQQQGPSSSTPPRGGTPPNSTAKPTRPLLASSNYTNKPGPPSTTQLSTSSSSSSSLTLSPESEPATTKQKEEKPILKPLLLNDLPAVSVTEVSADDDLLKTWGLDLDWETVLTRPLTVTSPDTHTQEDEEEKKESGGVEKEEQETVREAVIRQASRSKVAEKRRREGGAGAGVGGGEIVVPTRASSRAPTAVIAPLQQQSSQEKELPALPEVPNAMNVRQATIPRAFPQNLKGLQITTPQPQAASWGTTGVTSASASALTSARTPASSWSRPGSPVAPVPSRSIDPFTPSFHSLNPKQSFEFLQTHPSSLKNQSSSNNSPWTSSTNPRTPTAYTSSIYDPSTHPTLKQKGSRKKGFLNILTSLTKPKPTSTTSPTTSFPAPPPSAFTTFSILPPRTPTTTTEAAPQTSNPFSTLFRQPKTPKTPLTPFTAHFTTLSLRNPFSARTAGLNTAQTPTLGSSLTYVDPGGVLTVDREAEEYYSLLVSTGKNGSGLSPAVVKGGGVPPNAVGLDDRGKGGLSGGLKSLFATMKSGVKERSTSLAWEGGSNGKK
ncbi:hypothetical protein HDV05_004654 [Chytridiales sp. JEL 0842]|nr:hypothetical protein HDV05_004654 [Chytridiales sp. JEL 0842]